jgi:hypothetical protein
VSIQHSLTASTPLNLSSSPFEISGSVTASSDSIYSLRLNSSSSIGVLLQNTNATAGNPDIELLDSNGALVTIDGISQRSVNSSLVDLINVPELAAGVYYLRVFTDSPATANYQLTLQSQENRHAVLLWRYVGANSANQGRADYWRMNGTTFSQSETTSLQVKDLNWRIEGVGDFNNDGQSDILWRYLGSNAALNGRIDVWLMNGSTLVQSLTLGNAYSVSNPNWQVEGIGDFNGDGNTDILWRFNSTATASLAGRTDIWFLNGTTVNSTASLANQVTNLDWQIEAVGEFDSDRKADILWRYQGQGNSPRPGQLAWWYMDGVTRTQSVNLNTPQRANVDWQVQGVGDFNGDRQTDILWRYQGSHTDIIGRTEVWQMNGTDFVQSVPLSFQVADLDWQIEGVVPRYAITPRIDSVGNSFAKSLNIGNLNTTNEFREFVGQSDPDDYYRISSATTSYVQFSLEILSGDADLEVLQANGPYSYPLKSSQNPGTFAEKLTLFLDGDPSSPAIYYIRVSAKNGTDTRYNLKTNVLSANPSHTLDFNGAAPGFDATTTLVQAQGAIKLIPGNTLSITSAVSNTLSSVVIYRPFWDVSVETLRVDTTGTYIGRSYNPSTGEFILTGTASIADYEKVLRTLTFNGPPVGSRDIWFVANDGNTSSNVARITLNSKPLLATNPILLDYRSLNVAKGDFNHDGNLDLATSTAYSILIQLGNGDYTFTESSKLQLQNYSTSFTVGDFNGDGNLDLAARTFRSKYLSIFEGNGDGTFKDAIELDLGSEFDINYSVASADINKDGKLDLVVSDPLLGGISILWGNGNSTFTKGANVAGGVPGSRSPRSISFGDINADGNLDLVLAGGGDGIVYNQGDGTFSFRPVLQGSTAAATGDFDGDGIDDLVVLQHGLEFSFSKAPIIRLDGGGNSIVVDDFNLDGNLDVAVGDTSFRYYFGNGDGTFSAPIELYQGRGSNNASMISGDFNNDNLPDLVIPMRSEINILPNQFPNQTFTQMGTLAVGNQPSAITSGDFNGDGLKDLAVASESGNYISVLLGRGRGYFQNAVQYAVGTRPLAIATADLNQDGNLDLLVANADSNTVSILLGNQDGTFQTAIAYQVGLTPSGIQVADLNGDGKPDIITTDAGSNQVSVLLANSTNSFQTATSYAVGADPRSLTIADFNNDGKLDLAVANYQSSSISLLLGNQDGTFQAAVNFAMPAMPRAIATADLNDDGILDLVTVNDTANTVSVLRGNGNGTFRSAVSYAAGSSPSAIKIGDLNGDGKPDIIVTNRATRDNNSRNLAVLLGNGDTTFQNPLYFRNDPYWVFDAVPLSLTASINPTALELVDLNGDGKLDVVNGYYTSNIISTFFNQTIN